MESGEVSSSTTTRRRRRTAKKKNMFVPDMSTDYSWTDRLVLEGLLQRVLSKKLHKKME